MGLMELAGEVYEKINEHDGLGLSAEIAYQSLFAIFPFLLLLVSIASPLGRLSGVQIYIFTLIYDFAPPMATDFINSMILNVMEFNSLGVFSIGLLITLWAGSAVMSAMMKAFDRIYEVEESRSFMQRKILSMVSFVTTVLFFMISTVFVFVGDMLLAMVDGGALLHILQIAGLFSLVTVNVLLVNRFAPNVRLSFKKLLPGAVFFSSMWILATYLFKLYVSNFGRYSMIYGSIGGIIVLLTWIYMTAFLLLIGATINAVMINEK